MEKYLTATKKSQETGIAHCDNNHGTQTQPALDSKMNNDLFGSTLGHPGLTEQLNKSNILE